MDAEAKIKFQGFRIESAINDCQRLGSENTADRGAPPNASPTGEYEPGTNLVDSKSCMRLLFFDVAE
jgi:hypothetical protein